MELSLQRLCPVVVILLPRVVLAGPHVTETVAGIMVNVKHVLFVVATWLWFVKNVAMLKVGAMETALG